MFATNILCPSLAVLTLQSSSVSGFLWFSSEDITCQADWPLASQEKFPWEDSKLVVSRAAIREWNDVVPVVVNHAGGSSVRPANITNHVVMKDMTGLHSRATKDSAAPANTTTQEDCCVVN